MEYLIERKQADRVVMDPQKRNERALKCYEKCSFKKVRILPKHEYHEENFKIVGYWSTKDLTSLLQRTEI